MQLEGKSYQFSDCGETGLSSSAPDQLSGCNWFVGTGPRLLAAPLRILTNFLRSAGCSLQTLQLQSDETDRYHITERLANWARLEYRIITLPHSRNITFLVANSNSSNYSS